MAYREQEKPMYSVEIVEKSISCQLGQVFIWAHVMPQY